MKRFLLSLVIATSLAFTSCQFDDSDIWSKLGEVEESIRDHEQRISALEELCKQMNTNIEALQALVDALEKRDYITNISPIREDGVVIGYTISFAYGDTITIYHGEDGKDGANGADGKDGYTPQIGVMKDTDDIYYWTLDGKWLLDGKGNKIQANGVNGADGTNGSNGTNGTNGVTPQLKIESNYWYVSYDDGATWVQLGKATGEDGKNGQDSIIIGVEESETEVVFTLSDNTTITIPKHAKSSLADPDDICTAMDDVKFMEYCYQNFDVNKDGKVSPVEAKSVRNIDINGLEIYSIKGIEYFEILETLIAENTPLRNVDISFNNKLISFNFKNCSSMTSMVSPEGIATITEKAFYGCGKLESIIIPDSVTKIGDYAFYYCSSLTSVTIGNSVTSIGDCAFYNCTSLTSITIPDSVTSIGGSAFYYCSSLTSATIGNSVTSIGGSAFYGCTSLTSVTITDSVTSIGGSAFYYCSSLTSVYCKPTTPPTARHNIFYNNAYDRKIYVPAESVEAYKSAFGWSDYASDIVGYDFEKNEVVPEQPEYTLPEPQLVVTADEPYSSWKVSFNVKNPDWRTNPVDVVSFVANYTREFDSFMKTNKYTYTDMVMMNYGLAGYQLSDADVKMVNSDAGATIEFDVFENCEFTAAFMAWNKEGRASNPDSETCPGHANAKSLAATPEDALDMTKLNALKGDWTATATVMMFNAEEGTHTPTTRNWKVSIGDLNTNNSLSAADYAVFEAAGVNKAATDAYLAQFNELAANYNASVLGQNRVLCQGWDLSGTRETSTASPWDLFLMPDYNASLVDYLFNDFGPKWFLQTDADGNIFVPVNYNRVPKLTSWFDGQPHYLCGGNYEKGYANYINPNDMFDVQGVGIPVEISTDGNTVTLKAITINAEGQNISLYPTMIYDNQGQLAFYNHYVVSEVVLTKGWNGGATPAPAKASSSKSVRGKMVANGQYFKSPAKVFSRTALAPKNNMYSALSFSKHIL